MSKNKVESYALWVALFFVVVFGSIFAMPFHWFVDVKSTVYHDMCVGSDTQLVTSDREVHFLQAYKGYTVGELHRYEGQDKIETSIRRDVKFVYQYSENPVTYEVTWDKPVNVSGEYGASDYIVIEPLWVKKTMFVPEDEQRFKVIDC